MSRIRIKLNTDKITNQIEYGQDYESFEVGTFSWGHIDTTSKMCGTNIVDTLTPQRATTLITIANIVSFMITMFSKF